MSDVRGSERRVLRVVLRGYDSNLVRMKIINDCD